MTQPPFISVVIPTFQRNDMLAQCLERLAPGHQTLDLSYYEVIVTDAGRLSTAEEMIATRYPWAKWVSAPGCSSGPNRNRGARTAQGEWLVFVDDDCLPDSQWLAVLASEMRTGKYQVLEGRTSIPDFIDNPFLQAPDNEYGDAFWSCNLAIRRDQFVALGGFDPDFQAPCCEDMELAHRIRTRALPRRFCHDALVLHPQRRLSMAGLWQQTLNHRWHILFALKTGLAKPNQKAIPAVIQGLCRQLLNQLRETWHLFSKPQPSQWKSKWFRVAWFWLLSPVLLPYFGYWEYAFRKQLAASDARRVSE